MYKFTLYHDKLFQVNSIIVNMIYIFEHEYCVLI